MLSRKFSKPTVVEMLNISSISEDIQKEVGFPLCEKDQEITHNKELMCIGTKCSLVVSKECGNLKYVGFFHSHLKGAFPSFRDIRFAYQEGLICIGENDEQNTGTIFCHERKNIKYDPKIYDEIKKKERETSKDVREHEPKRILDKKIILNKHFNTIVFQKKPNSNIMVSDYEYKI
jgi:proteasome lid subunit RPN8/RPN11